MKIAGALAVSLLAIVAVFQLALALGAPFGKAAWGGRHSGVLPARLRLASAVAGILVYPPIIVIVLSSAGLIDADLVPGNTTAAMWTLAALFLVGTIANAVSRSTTERWWAPVSLAIAICCGVVATSP
jgi:hypothetical protein